MDGRGKSRQGIKSRLAGLAISDSRHPEGHLPSGPRLMNSPVRQTRYRVTDIQSLGVLLSINTA
jgi:hypothetical protein